MQRGATDSIQLTTGPSVILIFFDHSSMIDHFNFNHISRLGATSIQQQIANARLFLFPNNFRQERYEVILVERAEVDLVVVHEDLSQPPVRATATSNWHGRAAPAVLIHVGIACLSVHLLNSMRCRWAAFVVDIADLKIALTNVFPAFVKFASGADDI